MFQFTLPIANVCTSWWAATFELEKTLTSDVKDWLAEHAPDDLVRIETHDYRNAMITFRDLSTATYFKLRFARRD